MDDLNKNKEPGADDPAAPEISTPDDMPPVQTGNDPSHDLPAFPEPEPAVAGTGNRTGFAELVYGILFAPVATFRKIAVEPPLLYGFAVFLSVTILTSVVSSLVPSDFSNGSAEIADILSKTRPFIGIIGALLAITGWFVQAGVFQLFAELFGGKGRAIGVLTVLAFADLPRLVAIPFQVIGFFLAGSFGGKFITVAVSLAVFVWWAVLLVIGLREIQHYSTGRAVATVLIPLGVLLLTIIIFTAALVSFVALVGGGAY